LKGNAKHRKYGGLE